MLKRTWKILASVKTTFWLLGLVTLLFVIGSIYFRFEKRFLFQLNFLLFPDWIRTIGIKHIGISWWFFTLLSLLFLLGMNTFSCIVDRLTQLLPSWKKTGKLEFSLTLMPTVIHLLFLFILFGHLLSSITGSVETVECSAGQTIRLPNHRRIQILDLSFDFHEKPVSLLGKLKGAAATLLFSTPRKTSRFRVAIMSPAFQDGYSFHLDSYDKYAREKKMRLILRKDRGIRLIIPGLILIITLMAWYFPVLWWWKRKIGFQGE